MINSFRSYLDRPHDEATLADHRAFRLDVEEAKAPLVGVIRKFLGDDLVMEEGTFPFHDLPNIHRGLRKCFPDWQLETVTGGPCFASSIAWAPHYARVEVRPRIHRRYLADGALLFKTAGGGRRTIVLEDQPTATGRYVVMTSVAKCAEAKTVGREIKRLRRWIWRHHYLRGQALRANATLLPLADRLTWNDVMLDEAVEKTIQRQLIDYLAKRRLFQHNQIPQKRGILLYGPPGNGKTMIGRVVASSGQATFIWVTAADAERNTGLKNAFALARRLRPAVLFLEDLDFYASHRTLGQNGCLGELLAQMDGLERNDGIFVIGTTNDLAAIEPAIKERPSRFDVVLEIGLPKFPARRKMFAKNLARQIDSEAVLEMAGLRSEGLTGAQVREVSYLAIQEAILRGSIAQDQTAIVETRDIELSLERFAPPKQAIGFQRALSGRQSLRPSVHRNESSFV